MKMTVTNWPDYSAGLRRRGSLKLWVTEEGVADWRAQPAHLGRIQHYCIQVAGPLSEPLLCRGAGRLEANSAMPGEKRT